MHTAYVRKLCIKTSRQDLYHFVMSQLPVAASIPSPLAQFKLRKEKSVQRVTLILQT